LQHPACKLACRAAEAMASLMPGSRSNGGPQQTSAEQAEGTLSCRATGPTEGDDDPYIYKKGPAFGMPGVLVDGMDVMKVCLGFHIMPQIC
jgi:hypothetical protein